MQVASRTFTPFNEYLLKTTHDFPRAANSKAPSMGTKIFLKIHMAICFACPSKVIPAALLQLNVLGRSTKLKV